ncbi:pyruvate,water dikinase [Murinocardiopsis flavida]|uniref:Pyruvate,water dikinase n=1 Tax=Murinocardiopsis flavida TaxID=645275 RepID=A0A2P8DDZ9_9ACTN|nr:PEP/pyruvate-binding domain-containing protein [Murinocardiopsis flavida]PSK95450.1 pyruvate,water dikinase [Murinocardiopsis flavida]
MIGPDTGTSTRPQPAAADRLTAPLRDVGAHDLATAGGKGANLGELVRRGFPVPAGFVVTTAAYTALVERAGLAAPIAAALAGAGTAGGAGADGGADPGGAAIRAAFAAAEIPADLRAAVLSGYRDLGGGPVAVRSSATAEDLPGAAFAGQQDTFLNVEGDGPVLDAVARCWASLWTDRAIAYRRARGIPSDDVRIAVVVQRMVPAAAAGVLFTANPVTGARGDVVVDAGVGLGEAVVSGLVTPDHYVLGRDGRVRDYRPGGGEVVVRGAAGGGTEEVAGDGTARRLPDPVLRELVRLAVAAAEHFGRPQDIEWAYAPDAAPDTAAPGTAAAARGAVHLLQARPMTALPPPPLRLNPIQRRVAPFLVEMLPTRPYPLDRTSWMEHGPLEMVRRMMASVGVRFPRLDRIFPEEDGVVAGFVPPAPRPTVKLLAAPALLGYRAWRFSPARWTADPRFAAFQRVAEERTARDLHETPWSELRRYPRADLELMDAISALRIDYFPRGALSLLRLRLLLVRLRRRDLMADLMAGAPTRTRDANSALAELARSVRDDPALLAAFTGAEAADVLASVRTDARFRGFADRLTDFLAEYGHRETASPLLISAPTWVEAPEVVIGLVKVLAEERVAEAADGRNGAAEERLLDHPSLRSAARRSRALRTVRAAQSFVAIREDTHFHGTRLLPAIRRSLLEMGRRLHGAGVLDTPQDVFHLRLAELEAIGDAGRLPAADAERLRRTVLARSAKRAELAGVRLIDLTAVFPASGDSADTLANGTPASGGTATGRVRVIARAADFGTLRSGEVLVCPYNNPAWTPLFQRAAAVVVDTGGLASHAAIVAREYGIPAVMGTREGTAALADGLLVTVDGDRGTVTAADTGTGATGAP